MAAYLYCNNDLPWEQGWSENMTFEYIFIIMLNAVVLYEYIMSVRVG